MNANGRIGKVEHVTFYAETGCEEFARLRMRMARAENAGVDLPAKLLVDVKRLSGGHCGFGGSGEKFWEYKGEQYTETRSANGKTFWGTDCWIGKSTVRI